MKIKIYDTVKDFLEVNEAILLEKESVTQLILFNGFVNREKEISEDVLFGRVEESDGTPSLIFGNVSPYNLLIYNLVEDTDEAVKALVDYLIENKINIRGINANKKICDEFIEYYELKTGCHFKEYLAMDVMEIREVNEKNILPRGAFRVATLEDEDIFIDWYTKFVKEALNEDIIYEEVKNRFEAKLENGCIYFYEDENHIPMSMAAATRQLVNGVSVSLVYSRKKSRGKGYGLAVVYHLSKLYLERGNKFCSLFVDKHNPISNGVYKKIGYKILEDNFDYRIV